jgi:hypothetical protein
MSGDLLPPSTSWATSQGTRDNTAVAGLLPPGTYSAHPLPPLFRISHRHSIQPARPCSTPRSSTSASGSHTSLIAQRRSMGCSQTQRSRSTSPSSRTCTSSTSRGARHTGARYPALLPRATRSSTMSRGRACPKMRGDSYCASSFSTYYCCIRGTSLRRACFQTGVVFRTMPSGCVLFDLAAGYLF